MNPALKELALNEIGCFSELPSIDVLVWLTVSVPAHHRGVGWGRGQGSVGAGQVFPQ